MEIDCFGAEFDIFGIGVFAYSDGIITCVRGQALTESRAVFGILIPYRTDIIGNVGRQSIGNTVVYRTVISYVRSSQFGNHYPLIDDERTGSGCAGIVIGIGNAQAECISSGRSRCSKVVNGYFGTVFVKERPDNGAENCGGERGDIFGANVQIRPIAYGISADTVSGLYNPEGNVFHARFGNDVVRQRSVQRNLYRIIGNRHKSVGNEIGIIFCRSQRKVVCGQHVVIDQTVENRGVIADNRHNSFVGGNIV